MRVGARAALTEPVLSLLVRDRLRGKDAALDRQVAGVLELQRRMKLPELDTMEPARARAFAAEGLAPLEANFVGLAQVIDTRAGSVPVRIFVPHDAGPNWMVYFHGGGGVIGSARATERITRVIADQTKCTVASVDYRLGPEHKHPAAIDDAIEAFEAIAQRVPTEGKLAVAGDSFGGFLAAHVDHDSPVRPDLQILIYPLTDLTMASPGFTEFGEGYLYTRAMANYFRTHYLRDADDRREASPAHWAKVDSGTPSIVLTAGFDPLCAEGDAYAERLVAGGSQVIHRRHPGLVHGFLSLAGGVRAARAAVDEMCTEIARRLAS